MSASRKRKAPEVIIISSDEDEHPHAPERKRPKRLQESLAPETSTSRFCTNTSHQSSHTSYCEECGGKNLSKRRVANGLRTTAGPQSSREALLPRKSSFHQAEAPDPQQRLLGPNRPKPTEDQEGHTGPFSTRSSLIPISPSLTVSLSKQTTEELYQRASTDRQLAFMLYSPDSWYESRRLLNIRLQSPTEVAAMETLHPCLAASPIPRTASQASTSPAFNASLVPLLQARLSHPPAPLQMPSLPHQAPRTRLFRPQQPDRPPR